MYSLLIAASYVTQEELVVAASTSAPVIPNVYANAQTFDDATINVAYPPHPLTYSGGTAPVTWKLLSGTLGGLSFGDDGVISGTPSTAGAYDFIAQVTDANGMQASNTYHIEIAAAVGMSAAQIPQGVRGTGYVHDFSQYAFGGHPPYTFTDNNNRPSGLVLQSSGVLAGVPNTPQTVTIGITVTDSDGRTGFQTFDITIADRVAITTTSLARALSGASYTNTGINLAATGGSGTYTWTMTGNPSWLSLDSSTGALSGTAGATGTTSITFYATDTLGRQGSRTIDLVVYSTAVTLVTSTLGFATVGVPYTLQLSVSGGTEPYIYVNGTGAFPPGIWLDYNSGLIAGTPYDQLGGAPVITILDSAQPPGRVDQAFALRSANPLTVNAQTLPTGVVGTPYNGSGFQLTTSGGYGAVSFTPVTIGGGLSLSSSGLISGTPTASGPFNFYAVAYDSEGRSGNRSITLFVNSAVQIVTAALSDGIVGNSYTMGVTVSGGTRPFSWSVSAPSWLSFPTTNSTSTATLTGTPTVAGFTNVNIKVRDANAITNETTLSLFVSTSAAAPPVIQTPSPLTAGMVGNPYIGLQFQAVGGTPPYQWAITSGSAGGLTLTSSGFFSGTPTTASAWAFDVRVRDSLAATDTDHYTMTVATSVAGSNDWLYRSTLPNVTMATRFDTSAEVTQYAFLNTSYTNDTTRVRQVPSSDPIDGAKVISGNNGMLKITFPSSFTNGALNWVRRLNDSWTNGTNEDLGFGPGEDFWVYVRTRIPRYLAEANWLHTNSQQGGFKNHIINRWRAANTNGQMYIINYRYNDVWQGQWGPSGGNGMEDYYPAGFGGVGSEYIQQPAVNHIYPSTHPAGLDPATGTTYERARKNHGSLRTMTYSTRTDDAYATRDPRDGNINPRGSDQSSGAMMLRRDCADKWVGFLHHIKVGTTFSTADGIWETWGHLEGKDYIPLWRSNTMQFNAVTEALSATINTAYQTSNNPTGSSLPGGSHKYNGIWLLHQNTSRVADSNQHPDYINLGANQPPVEVFYGEVICRSGTEGIPAPGFIAPPLSYYNSGAYIPTTAGAVASLTSTTSGRDTISSALPSGWRNNSSGIGELITTVYSECAWDPIRNVAYVHGGGHSDSACNWVVKFELGDGATAIGFTGIDGSSASAPPVQAATSSNNYSYTDGRPASVHTYRGTCVDNDGHYYRFGGSMYNSGSAMPRLWEFNPSTLAWTSYLTPTQMNSRFDVYANYDWIRNLILFVSVSSQHYITFDCTTKQWGTIRALPNQPASLTSDTGVSELSLINGEMRLIVFGNMSPAGRESVYTWNGTTLSVNQHLTFSGDTAIYNVSGPGCVWDREDNCFWGCHYTSSTLENYVYRGLWTSSTNIDWTRYTVGGGSIGWLGSGYPNRTFHRLFPVTGRDSLLVIKNQREAARLIRKPA